MNNEILIGENLGLAIGTEIDMQVAHWTRLQRPCFWHSGEKISRVRVIRREGRAPGDVDYYGVRVS